VVGAAVSGLVSGWFGGEGAGRSKSGPVGLEQVVLGRAGGSLGGGEVRNGLFCLLICVVTAAVLIRVTGGPLVSTVRQGQVYFSLGVGFFVAALLGQWVSRARLAVWALLAVPVVAIGGYGWGWLRPIAPVPPAYQAIEHIMPNFACRALPVEYCSVGVAGALCGIWMGWRLQGRGDGRGPERSA
jgi:hypothetical protein